MTNSFPSALILNHSRLKKTFASKMNHSLLIVLIFMIEASIILLMKLVDDKPDILRIWYQDIPLLYVVGPSVMYFLTLFQLVGMISMPILISIHLFFQMILRYFLSTYFQNKHDYFHLLTRYYTEVKLVHRVAADALYICGLIVLYRIMNPYMKDRYMNLLASVVGYIAFTLTFEDV